MASTTVAIGILVATEILFFGLSASTTLGLQWGLIGLGASFIVIDSGIWIGRVVLSTKKTESKQNTSDLKIVRVDPPEPKFKEKEIKSTALISQPQPKLSPSEPKEEKYAHCLFKIKNEEKETVGYLLGTLHEARQWGFLNKKLVEKINKSQEFFFEADMNSICKDILKELPDSKQVITAIDTLVALRALARGKSCTGLETDVEQKKVLKKKEEVIRNSPSTYENGEWISISWNGGNEELIENRLMKCTSDKKDLYQILLERRNAAWMDNTLEEEIMDANSSQKLFIAVGWNHLYDFPQIDCTGLITRINNLGFTLLPIL